MAFARSMASSAAIDIDEESYEEVRAISMDLEDSLSDLSG